MGTLAVCALPLLAGCDGGVQWEFRTFRDAHEIARDANKLTFVYFRNWYSVECTRFEENILKHPEVLAETRGMVCVPLDFDYDQSLARRWRLQKTPAYVIVTPDRSILARADAPITRDDLLEAMRLAKATFAPSTQPRTAPEGTPP